MKKSEDLSYFGYSTGWPGYLSLQWRGFHHSEEGLRELVETRRESGSWKAKHSRILAAALDEFIDSGYTGGSMDRIALKAKVSKVTVYNHFENKDLLYRRTFEYYLAEVHPGAPAIDKRLELAPKEILTRYAADLIAVMTHQRAVGMLRLLRSDPLILTNALLEHHESKLLPDIKEITSYLTWEHGGGRLRVKNPDVAARQLTGMLFENTLYPTLMGLKVDLSKIRIGEVVDTSVAVFLSHYET